MMRKARARLAQQNCSPYLENRIKRLIAELDAPIRELEELALFHFPYSQLLEHACRLGALKDALWRTGLNDLMEPSNA